MPEFLAWIYTRAAVSSRRTKCRQPWGTCDSPRHYAPEAAGWFRGEIKTANDLKGLKMRFFGLGAKMMDKLGVASQLPPGTLH